MKRILGLSAAWLCGMTGLYCGAFFLVYGHLPAWH
jgi:hypothetical protein